jgi:tRNA nucleotidyltransferase/poly(A) polymerase
MKILDFTKQGVSDIRNKIVRVTDTENAEIIFKQDPLRILRALRQSLQLSFKIESRTYDAMRVSSPYIRIVSPERVRDEINKILAEKNPSKAFKTMHEINLLAEILPELEKLNNLRFSYIGKSLFTRILKILDKTRNNIILRIALLLHFTGKYNYKGEGSKTYSREYNTDSAKEAEIILNRLKYPKEFIKKTLLIIQNRVYPKMRSSCGTDAEIRKFAKKCGSELNLILEFSRAGQFHAAARGEIDELKTRIEYLSSKNILYVKPLLSGKEIMSISSGSAGKWVQEAKNKIEEIQFENPELTKGEAIEIIKKVFNKRKLNA